MGAKALALLTDSTEAGGKAGAQIA